MIKENPSVLTDYLEDETSKKHAKLRRKMCVFDDNYVSLFDMIKTTKFKRKGKEGTGSALLVHSIQENKDISTIMKTKLTAAKFPKLPEGGGNNAGGGLKLSSRTSP